MTRGEMKPGTLTPDHRYSISGRHNGSPPSEL
jgi:hypothetical protein